MPMAAPAPMPMATEPGDPGDRRAVLTRITVAYPAITIRKTASPSQATAAPCALLGGASATRSTAALTSTRASTAAYPPPRTTRASRVFATGPRARRTTHGRPTSITAIVITSTLLIATAESPAGPDHALHAVAAAAASTSG